MKARVIKEWEMYGITHKVGEIMTISLHSPSGLPMISDRDAFLLENGFIEEIKEPLIKDEKIRKAVRAWAVANVINSGHYYNTDIKFNATEHRLQWIQTAIEFNDITGLDNLEDGETYTIDELCGEEEE